jgi:peptide methionine sulfoxide reductase MsrA
MSDNVETAILAGGCYWIMQPLLRHPDGVIFQRYPEGCTPFPRLGVGAANRETAA